MDRMRPIAVGESLDYLEGNGIVEGYVEDLRHELDTLDHGAVGAVVDTIAAAIFSGATIYLAGNGGSATAASHMAADWSSAALVRGRRTHILNMAESVGRVTALGNDIAFEEIFAEQLTATGQRGDLLVVLSVSGSSPNILLAVKRAQALGMPVVGLLGRIGTVGSFCAAAAVLGGADYGLTEDLHLSVNHMVVRALRGGAHRYETARAHVSLNQMGAASDRALSRARMTGSTLESTRDEE